MDKGSQAKIKIMFTQQQKGIFYVVMGTLLFSSKAIIVKMLFQIGLGALELQTLRMLFILPFYLVILYWAVSRRGWGISNRDLIGAVLAGVACYHIASYLDLQGLLYISAGLERMILFCYPAISMLFAWVFLKETVSRRLWLALVVAYSGIGLFFFADLSFGGENLWLGSVLVFIASVFTAWYMVANQIYSRRIGSQRFTCIAMIGAAVTMLMHATAVGVQDLSTFTGTMYAGAATIAIFCTLIPSFLVSAGVKIVGASKAGIVGAVGPLMTTILSNYLLQEPLGWMHFVGLTLVIVGMRLLK
ncbi:DMT family transporter [uncultured Paraglaciecola sp.]|uniref:DMT family transporter n=1 Tax=uncultured Paraglaciecola sp. TaxID=1765024 RepID=UPI0025D59D43|nr:DMT family transporter [uncultured Paraglaciecola sp.]